MAHSRGKCISYAAPRTHDLLWICLTRYGIILLRAVKEGEEILYSYGKYFWRQSRAVPPPLSSHDDPSSILRSEFKALFAKTAVVAASSRSDLAPLETTFMQLVNLLNPAPAGTTSARVAKRRRGEAIVDEPEMKRIALVEARIAALEALKIVEMVELERLKAASNKRKHVDDGCKSVGMTLAESSKRKHATGVLKDSGGSGSGGSAHSRDGGEDSGGSGSSDEDCDAAASAALHSGSGGDGDSEDSASGSGSSGSGEEGNSNDSGGSGSSGEGSGSAFALLHPGSGHGAKGDDSGSCREASCDDEGDLVIEDLVSRSSFDDDDGCVQDVPEDQIVDEDEDVQYLDMKRQEGILGVDVEQGDGATIYLHAYRRLDGFQEALRIFEEPPNWLNSTCLGIIANVVNVDAAAKSSCFRSLDPFFTFRFVFIPYHWLLLSLAFCL